jgi:hypothetical protein
VTTASRHDEVASIGGRPDRVPVDEALACGRRGLHSRPGTLLLGPTGARLWADFLEERVGFVGAIDYIHKINLPLLFTVEPDAGGPCPSEPADVVWCPSHLRMTKRFGQLVVRERKTISWDDRAISEQEWTNHGSTPATIRLRWDETWSRRQGGVVRGSRDIPDHGFTLATTITTDSTAVLDGLVVPPGGSVRLTVSAAVTIQDELPDGRPVADPVTAPSGPSTRSGSTSSRGFVAAARRWTGHGTTGGSSSATTWRDHAAAPSSTGSSTRADPTR